MTDSYDLEQRLEKAEWVLNNAGFRRCDIPACNCGSWHQIGGFKARFDEIKEAVEEAAYSTNGKTLLDVVKEVIADARRTGAVAQGQQERIAELQYEAGMYKSLYENAVASQPSPAATVERPEYEYVDGQAVAISPGPHAPDSRSSAANGGARAALDKLADKVAAKINQLQYYRDNDCQLDHAKTIAEGRLQQANQILHWIAEAAVSHTSEPQTALDSALAKCEECGTGPCESCMNSGYKHPDRAELALAADELAKLPDAIYWILAKGRTRPDEPLWGIGITNHAGEAIAEAEGDHPADVVRAAASKISRSTS